MFINSFFISPFETVCAVLTVALVVVISMLIGYLVHKVIRDKGYKNNLPLTLTAASVLSIAMLFRFGTSITLIQGMFLFFVLFFASVSDITRHEVDDHIWVTVFALSLVSIPNVGITSMLIGAVMVFVPQMFVSLIGNKSIGGADIKLSTSIAFLLGWQRGLLTLFVGMLLAIVCKKLSDPLHWKEDKEPFALIPYISVATMLVFLI